jgi:hypothetical protein
VFTHTAINASNKAAITRAFARPVAI